MSSDYVGWSLFDKVLIVAKKCMEWRGNKYELTDTLQGYVVDPSNKSMLDSAIHWGTESHRLDEKDEQGNYLYEKIEPAQYLFENKDFTLQLLDSAQGSSQGGKLSFWNCLITKGEYQFKIGIAADLLLQLLKQSTFINGVCQGKVFFARCKGGVGMLHTDMPAYKEAVADMDRKAAVKSAKKTTKWQIGCNYITLKEDEMCLCSAYRWVVPTYYKDRYGIDRFYGYKKLKKPELVYFTAITRANYNSVSEYFDNDVYLHERVKFPSRMKGTIELNCDMSSDMIDKYFYGKALEALTAQLEHQKTCKSKGWSYNLYDRRDVGISTQSECYELPEDIKKLIIECGLEYKEE